MNIIKNLLLLLCVSYASTTGLIDFKKENYFEICDP